MQCEKNKFFLYFARLVVTLPLKKRMKNKLLNIKGKLFSLEKPVVMGILNVTPDSFFAESRMQNETAVTARIEAIITEGGAIVDIGGCSSRPGADVIPQEEEWRRLEPTLNILAEKFPQIPVSIDTFRADIAKRAVEEYGVAVINDISGGSMDDDMFVTVAKLNVPYILTHFQQTAQKINLFQAEVMSYFAEKLQILRRLGVNDIILDPGFGFGKTLEQNYELMRSMHNFSIFFECPLLVGISRKSMIYSVLGHTATESLNGTTVLNTYSLLNGADILRVHDVKAAVEAVKLIEKIKK